MPGPAIRAVAEIDLGAVAANVRQLRSHIGERVRLCAVIKADAYGHGAIPVARAAVTAGADQLGVFTVDEAADLRAAGVTAPVLLLGPLTPAELALAARLEVETVAWSAQHVEGVAARGGGTVHVEIDSGMGRFGLKDADSLRELTSRLALHQSVRVGGLMTHLATADEDQRFAAEQLRRFRDLAAEAFTPDRRPILHVANSAAALGMPEARLDMVRCGIALYGIDPYHENPRRHGLRPAMRVVSDIAALRPLETGESVGYGRRWHATEPTWVATVPMGYADGIPRAATERIEVLIGGRRHPAIGMISMDSLTVNLGRRRTGDAPAAIGDEVVLLGAQGAEEISAEEIAARRGTIGYEVVTAISKRVPRRYLRPG